MSDFLDMVVGTGGGKGKGKKDPTPCLLKFFRFTSLRPGYTLAQFKEWAEKAKESPTPTVEVVEAAYGPTGQSNGGEQVILSSAMMLKATGIMGIARASKESPVVLVVSAKEWAETVGPFIEKAYEARLKKALGKA